jgi:hypothetical protein
MVVFMGHALLLCGVRLDVDNVPDVVVDQESRQFYGAMLCVLQSAFHFPLNNANAPLKPRLNMWRVRAR